MSVRLRKWTDVQDKVHEAWMVDVVFQHPDGHRQRVERASPVNTRRGAEQYERELRNSLLEGTFGQSTAPAPTLRAFGPRWLEHAETNDKQSSARAKRHILGSVTAEGKKRGHLVHFFGDLRLDQVTAGKIEAYKTAKLKVGLSKKTINNHLAALSSLLDVAKLFDELPDDHALPAINWFPNVKPEITFLTFEEAVKFEAGLPHDRWGTLARLILKTGLRIGEAVVLQWSDVEAGRLQVNRAVDRGKLDLPKGGQKRVVPLTEQAQALLKSWPRRIESPWIFPQKIARGQEHAGFIRAPHGAAADAMRRMGDSILGRRIGWHTLRHTFASHLVMRGVSLRVVQGYLGHQSIEMTERYAHLAPAHLDEAIRVLDAPHRAPVAAGARHGRDMTSDNTEKLASIGT